MTGSARTSSGVAVRALSWRVAASRVADLIALTKPRIVAMAMLMAAGGAALAPGSVTAATFVVAILGTGLLVAAATTLNMYLERDVDRLMARTADRPLPAGRLAPSTALAFGLALGGAGTSLLVARVNLLTAGLGLLALVLYLLAYTPLKRHSALALFVGAVPGAMPPLMGWTAATGGLAPPGLALAAVLYVWQIPHFLAIASYLRDDYARAGIHVVPLARGERATRRGIVVGAAALLLVSLLLTPLGGAGVTYFVLALALGASFLGLAARGLGRDAGERGDRLTFVASLVYLPALTAALLLDGLVR